MEENARGATDHRENKVWCLPIPPCLHCTYTTRTLFSVPLPFALASPFTPFLRLCSTLSRRTNTYPFFTTLSSLYPHTWASPSHAPYLLPANHPLCATSLVTDTVQSGPGSLRHLASKASSAIPGSVQDECARIEGPVGGCRPHSRQVL